MTSNGVGRVVFYAVIAVALAEIVAEPAEGLTRRRVVYDKTNPLHPLHQKAIAFLEKNSEATKGYASPPCGEGGGWGNCVQECFERPDANSKYSVKTTWFNWDNNHMADCSVIPGGADVCFGQGSCHPVSEVETIVETPKKVCMILKSWSDTDTRCIHTEVSFGNFSFGNFPGPDDSSIGTAFRKGLGPK